MSRYRDYGGSTSRYANTGNVRAFSIPDVDFHRHDTTLKRRRASPPRPVPLVRRSSASEASIAMRGSFHARSRSVAPKNPGQEFVALGSSRPGDNPRTLNTNKASYHHHHHHHASTAETYKASRGSSHASHAARGDDTLRMRSPGRKKTSPISQRTRSKSVTRGQHAGTAERRTLRDRSRSAARRSGGACSTSRKEGTATSSSSSSRSREMTRERSRSKDRAQARVHKPERRRSLSRSRALETSLNEEKMLRTSSRSEQCTSKSASSLQGIEDTIARNEQALKPKQKELKELQEQLAKLQKRIEAKELEVYDIQVDLDALRKRRERRLPSHQSDCVEVTRSQRTRSKSKGRERGRSSSKPRASKRPCIVDEEDEEGSDDDVVIIDPVEVKREQEKESSVGVSQRTVVPVEDSVPDHFWGRSATPKLLANHRFRAFPDGSVRKGRHLAFNPIQSQYFATSSDEGGLILWSYQRHDQDIAKVVTLTPSSFRKDSQCAEAISWSPDGNRIAMAFRDALDEMGEFCVVQLHQLKLEDSRTPQTLPKDRITSKRTTLHPRGISAIDWLPSGFGSEITSRQVITTGNSDHAVVLWEEHENRTSGGLDLKWHVLHRDHRSEVKSLCVHSKRDCLYTGGLDGLLIRYDMNKGCTETVLERRKPTICKINSVLEHPHNPNLLLVSCVEQSRHSMLLHDLRQRDGNKGMSLVREGGSMSQYVVPRWSPAGYHVSCGSKTGLVNIWDVRMRGENYPTVEPQQALRVHHKTVLHATWHPQYDALFSVSHDRTIGLLTFR